MSLDACGQSPARAAHHGGTMTPCDSLQKQIDSVMNKYDLMVDPYVYYCNNVVPLVEHFVKENGINGLTLNKTESAFVAYYECVLYAYVTGMEIDDAKVADMVVNYFPELAGFVPKEALVGALRNTLGEAMIDTRRVVQYANSVTTFFGNFFWCRFSSARMNITKKQLVQLQGDNGLLLININYNNARKDSNYSCIPVRRRHEELRVVSPEDIETYKKYYTERSFEEPSEMYEISSMRFEKYLVALRYNRDNFTICLPNVGDDVYFSKDFVNKLLTREYAGEHLLNVCFIFYNIIDKVAKYLPSYASKSDANITQLAKLADVDEIAKQITDKHKRFIFLCNIEEMRDVFDKITPALITTALENTFGKREQSMEMV